MKVINKSKRIEIFMREDGTFLVVSPTVDYNLQEISKQDAELVKSRGLDTVIVQG